MASDLLKQYTKPELKMVFTNFVNIVATSNLEGYDKTIIDNWEGIGI